MINKKEKEPIMNSMSFKIEFIVLSQHDHLAKPHILTDENCQISWYGDYEPFGKVNIMVERTKNNFRFPGQYYIAETGLYYNWNRNYNYFTGRYNEHDVLGETLLVKNKIVSPIFFFSDYVYSFSNPLLYTDREGFQSRDEIIKCLGEADRCHYFCWVRCLYNISTCAKDSFLCMVCLYTAKYKPLCYKICTNATWSCYWTEECLYECEKMCDKGFRDCLCIK